MTNIPCKVLVNKDTVEAHKAATYLKTTDDWLDYESDGYISGIYNHLRNKYPEKDGVWLCAVIQIAVEGLV